MNPSRQLPIVAFSHLRWDFVYQRPQQLLSRIALRQPVFFFEEPEYDPSAGPEFVITTPAPGVTVLRPRTPCPEAGFSDGQMPHLRSLIRSFAAWDEIRECILWMYTPMALPLSTLFDNRATVYDCMDELSAFDYAPLQMTQREAELLQEADVVFTGGPSLFQKKRQMHPRVYCFPSSVDQAHFGQAKRAISEPSDQQGIPHPRLGFFGVLDERIDVELLDGLARARPSWHLVLIGPTAKIDAGRLPSAPNVHVLGMRPYADLPSYLSGWDVCLLPFARNRATKYISPTKTLEYMAAEKPIVSTPITDVADPYADVVYLGSDLPGFIGACEKAMDAPKTERTRRTAAMRRILSRTSWDRTVASMCETVDSILNKTPQDNPSPSLLCADT